jgi:cellulose synthase operon protein C
MPKRALISALMMLMALYIAGCSSSAERAQRYYESGVKLLAQHDNQRAAIEFKNAIKLKRDLIPAWRGLAQVEEANQHWENLINILHTITELDANDKAAKLKLAKLLLFIGASDQALKLSDELDQGDPNVLALKAAIFYRLKDESGAEREATAALAIDPGHIDAKMVLTALRLANGNAKEALVLLNSLPSEHATDLGVQLFRIKILERLGDLPQLEVLLRKLTELYPQETAFRTQLIRFLVDQHRPADAERELRVIASGDPGNSQAGLDVVRFLYLTKGAEAARQELVSRIDAGGDVFPYQMALAELDYGRGNIANAYKLLETLSNDTGSSEHALSAMVKLADMYVGQKNISGAEALVSDVLRRDGRNVGALRLRAIIHIERDQLEPAIADLREALNDQSRSPELMVLLATAYERSGAIELADKEYADALKASGFNPGVGLNYAVFLRRRGNLQRAEDVLTELANRQPKNTQILSALAEMKLAREDWIGAQEISEAIRRAGGNDGTADQILGVALSGRHKTDESIAAFQNAVTAAPTAAQPMAALVRALVNAKQSDKAVSFLQSILKTNPNNAEAYVLLGSIRLANNAPDQAMKNFMAAVEKQPKNAIGYRALADFHLSQKNNDAALKAVRAGLKEIPDSSILHLALAGILERNRDYEGAIAEYEHLLTQDPGSLIAANNLANTLSDHRTDKASLERAQALATGLRKSPVPQFKDTLGWVNFRRGDVNDAVPLLEEAAAELPDLALVDYHLGMSYSATGREAKAMEAFKRALTKAPSPELQDAIKAELKKTATQ